MLLSTRRLSRWVEYLYYYYLLSFVLGTYLSEIFYFLPLVIDFSTRRSRR